MTIRRRPPADDRRRARPRSARGHRAAPAIALAAATLLAAVPSRAAFEDRYGYSARGIALANAMAALADDATATYYNPAALGVVDRSSATAGFVFGAPSFRAVNRETGERVDNGIRDQNQAVMGMVADLSPDFGELRVGLMAVLPAHFIARVPLPAGGEPQYLSFSRTQEPIVEIGLAYPLTDWLSVGVGMNVFLGIRLAVDVITPIQVVVGGDDSVVDVAVPLELIGDYAETPYVVEPNAGILLTPRDDLRIGIAYRDTLQIPVGVDIELLLPAASLQDLLRFPLDLEWIALFRPRQVSAGVAWEIDPDWTVAFELTWFDWGDVERTQIQVRENEVLAIPLDEQQDLVRLLFGKNAIEPDARSTFVPRVGVEWTGWPTLALRAGYYWERPGYTNPSPDTSFLEPERHVFSAGLGHVVVDPVGLGDPGKRLSIDGVFQYQLLGEGDAAGFRHEGDVIAISATATYVF